MPRGRPKKKKDFLSPYVKNIEYADKPFVDAPKGPVSPATTKMVEGGSYVNRVLVATPTVGSVRMEWVNARYGQTIPMNWSYIQYIHFMNAFTPIHFQVHDAQNVIVKEAIEKDMEWLLLIEDDTIPPADAFLRFNKYMRDGNVPVVSGLYFSRAEPSEPLVFRGRGNSVYWDWKFGDLVWADGVPTGMLLIHVKLLKAMWDESPEYKVHNVITRRVFKDPQHLTIVPGQGYYATSGTSDLDWCTRVIEENFFEKSGWDAYKSKKHPFLVDTNIFCRHIDRHTGQQYPSEHLLLKTK